MFYFQTHCGARSKIVFLGCSRRDNASCTGGYIQRSKTIESAWISNCAPVCGRQRWNGSLINSTAIMLNATNLIRPPPNTRDTQRPLVSNSPRDWGPCFDEDEETLWNYSVGGTTAKTCWRSCNRCRSEIGNEWTNVNVNKVALGIWVFGESECQRSVCVCVCGWVEAGNKTTQSLPLSWKLLPNERAVEKKK